MPFDRQAVASLRTRMLAETRPTGELAGLAQDLAAAARSAGDAAGEFEALYLLLVLLAWQGAVEAAAGPLARLAALAPMHLGVFAQRAEFARLAGDRREAARHCEDAWLRVEADLADPSDAEGRGLLLGCWAWASADPDKFDWCVETGNDLVAAGELTDLDVVAFRGHIADAAMDLEDIDLAYEQANAAVKFFAREAPPPLVHFLWRRCIALCHAAEGDFEDDVTALLRELVAEAERNGWTAWLPALDAALALAPEE